ncbi:hypothetical protein FEM48_Zijuj03G0096600 [Ziziphus jujuba var. spinosa]|uniref:Uncharacterized protein n=1 Tax=Ziziphus jujuba var. spinosa TaxID=714518 RepID=A0A978VPJ7_ZIZJJ|nr:hypothetical protein FEM48_Zijuj03G0096600 [Ziziphus jujuba var. spinosa]
MENKKQVGGSSNSSMTLDYIFGPKDSAATVSSSSSTGLFGSIFPPPSTVLGRERKQDFGTQVVNSKYERPDTTSQRSKSESSSIKGKDSTYQNESAEPCYFSSSIYYGGQENYSPRTRATESQNVVHSITKTIVCNL